jgi:hypothetical protein
MKRFPFGAASFLLLLSACSSVVETLPERSATEQLLLSTAADKAVAELEMPLPKGAKVYLDESRFEAYDRGYALGALRARLLREGAALVAKRDEADLILEARAGALSINDSDELLGIPSFEVPVPLAGVFETPQLALYKRSEQVGVAKLGLSGYWRESGEMLFAGSPAFGLAWHDRYAVVGYGWVEGDVDLEDGSP